MPKRLFPLSQSLFPIPTMKEGKGALFETARDWHAWRLACLLIRGILQTTLAPPPTTESSAYFHLSFSQRQQNDAREIRLHLGRLTHYFALKGRRHVFTLEGGGVFSRMMAELPFEWWL